MAASQVPPTPSSPRRHAAWLATWAASATAAAATGATAAAAARVAPLLTGGPAGVDDGGDIDSGGEAHEVEAGGDGHRRAGYALGRLVGMALVRGGDGEGDDSGGALTDWATCRDCAAAVVSASAAAGDAVGAAGWDAGVRWRWVALRQPVCPFDLARCGVIATAARAHRLSCTRPQPTMAAGWLTGAVGYLQCAVVAHATTAVADALCMVGMLTADGTTPLPALPPLLSCCGARALAAAACTLLAADLRNLPSVRALAGAAAAASSTVWHTSTCTDCDADAVIDVVDDVVAVAWGAVCCAVRSPSWAALLPARAAGIAVCAAAAFAAAPAPAASLACVRSVLAALPALHPYLPHDDPHLLPPSAVARALTSAACGIEFDRGCLTVRAACAPVKLVAAGSPPASACQLEAVYDWWRCVAAGVALLPPDTLAAPFTAAGTRVLVAGVGTHGDDIVLSGAPPDADATRHTVLACAAVPTLIAAAAAATVALAAAAEVLGGNGALDDDAAAACGTAWVDVRAAVAAWMQLSAAAPLPGAQLLHVDDVVAAEAGTLPLTPPLAAGERCTVAALQSLCHLPLLPAGAASWSLTTARLPPTILAPTLHAVASMESPRAALHAAALLRQVGEAATHVPAATAAALLAGAAALFERGRKGLPPSSSDRGGGGEDDDPDDTAARDAAAQVAHDAALRGQVAARMGRDVVAEVASALARQSAVAWVPSGAARCVLLPRTTPADAPGTAWTTRWLAGAWQARWLRAMLAAAISMAAAHLAAPSSSNADRAGVATSVGATLAACADGSVVATLCAHLLAAAPLLPPACKPPLYRAAVSAFLTPLPPGDDDGGDADSPAAAAPRVPYRLACTDIGSEVTFVAAAACLPAPPPPLADASDAALPLLARVAASMCTDAPALLSFVQAVCAVVACVVAAPLPPPPAAAAASHTPARRGRAAAAADFDAAGAARTAARLLAVPGVPAKCLTDLAAVASHRDALYLLTTAARLLEVAPYHAAGGGVVGRDLAAVCGCRTASDAAAPSEPAAAAGALQLVASLAADLVQVGGGRDADAGIRLVDLEALGCALADALAVLSPEAPPDAVLPLLRELAGLGARVTHLVDAGTLPAGAPRKLARLARAVDDACAATAGVHPDTLPRLPPACQTGARAAAGSPASSPPSARRPRGRGGRRPALAARASVIPAAPPTPAATEDSCPPAWHTAWRVAPAAAPVPGVAPAPLPVAATTPRLPRVRGGLESGIARLLAGGGSGGGRRLHRLGEPAARSPSSSSGDDTGRHAAAAPAVAPSPPPRHAPPPLASPAPPSALPPPLPPHTAAPAAAASAAAVAPAAASGSDPSPTDAAAMVMYYYAAVMGAAALQFQAQSTALVASPPPGSTRKRRTPGDGGGGSSGRRGRERDAGGSGQGSQRRQQQRHRGSHSRSRSRSSHSSYSGRRHGGRRHRSASSGSFSGSGSERSRSRGRRDTWRRRGGGREESTERGASASAGARAPALSRSASAAWDVEDDTASSWGGADRHLPAPPRRRLR